MRSTRLAAAGVAAGALVLGMAGPALADGKVVANPNPFTAGSAITVNVSGCNAESKPVLAHGGTIVFAQPVTFTRKGDLWTSGPVKTFDSRQLKAGQTYPYKVTCHDADQNKLTMDLPLKVAASSENPDPQPGFKFGYDKVKLSTTRVAPGEKTTFKVICPSTVTITGNGYTQNPLPAKKTGENTWGATGTFKSSLPDPTNVTVVCKGFGSVKYSTSPAKDDGNGNGNGGGNNMTPKTPKVPTGPINTGDGSTLNNGGSPMAAAAWGAIAFLGLGAVALRRRTAQERS
ncbi:hypothetical protein [Actinomadura sp. 7K507]|uniref:hypothetical protein n=1 Tax=Actinomadura sp. 7K507 TaxID=2530365 RepID=UPI00104AB7CE|nr:hypothetical protein [Actinomadura sp. 7K507]TDC78260.1 hypothetical protein E1285_37615 [Actinomadura sp. 7K507]